jgi:hypothetical protein
VDLGQAPSIGRERVNPEIPEELDLTRPTTDLSWNDERCIDPYRYPARNRRGDKSFDFVVGCCHS